LVYEIVKQHGGEVSIESEVGAGTTMCVRLLSTTSDDHAEGGGEP
jgi:signal transduction histidine kinase